MVQSCQGVRSTKSKNKTNQPTTKDMDELPPPGKTNEIHVWDEPIRNLYTDDYGRFPISSRSGKEYIIITYHCNTNTILHTTFANRKDKHKIAAYNSIMARLTKRGHKVNIHILDHEVSEEYKRIIEENWKVTYQLVSPNVHRINIAERAICTLKAHFCSILAGVDPNFPKFMWDKPWDQT